MLLHGMFVVCVAFPIVASYSDFQSLVWGVLVWTAQHTPVPSNTGGHTSYFILTTRLSFDTGRFQTIGASTFYIRASLQKSPNVYSNIVWVLHPVPILAHRTIAIRLLCFQICLGIHPPLSLHHMLEAPFPLLLCNTMT